MAQTFLKRLFRAVDRLDNVLTGGDDEETVSHRSARAMVRGRWWGIGMCWFLDKWKYVFFWDRQWWDAWDNHCRKVLAHPNPSDATVPLDAPLKGDANYEDAPRQSDACCGGEY